MALIKCPECGKEVSDRARQCVNCGYPFRKTNEQAEYFSQNAVHQELQQKLPANKMPNQNNNKGKRDYLWAGIVLVLAIAVVVLIVIALTPVTATPRRAVTTVEPTVMVTATPTVTPTKEKTSNVSSSKDTVSTKTSFTNKFGTPTTKCAHPGCNNYIASSGDTNCCTTHSNKCAECGKYIDEDATYCMDCLTKAAKKVNSSSRKCDKTGCSNNASQTLTVTQPTGESETFYLCSSHYSEYKSFFNSKKGWTAR